MKKATARGLEHEKQLGFVNCENQAFRTRGIQKLELMNDTLG